MNVEALIFQQIVDANFDQAIYTASPNNTINVVQIAAKGSGTNIGLAITPKGTGYLSAQVPDGATAGGSARGARSVDFQTSRTAATQVASGASSIILAGINNTSSGQSSVSGGSNNIASGTESVALGQSNTASSQSCVSLGQSCSATGSRSVAIGTSAIASATNSFSIGRATDASNLFCLATGAWSRAYLSNQRSHGGGNVALSVFIGQETMVLFGGQTTTNASVGLRVPAAGGERAVLRDNSIWSGIFNLIGNKSDGTAFARFSRQITIRRVSSVTSLVGSVVAIGTDEASGTSLSITADDVNEALDIAVTGIASETWNWQGIFHGVEKAL
jgi:hypothetical protein